MLLLVVGRTRWKPIFAGDSIMMELRPRIIRRFLREHSINVKEVRNSESASARAEALTSARKQGFEGVEKSDEVALYRLTARESSVLAA